MVSHRRKKIRLDSNRRRPSYGQLSKAHAGPQPPLALPAPPLRPSCTPTASFLRRQESRGAGRAIPVTTPARLTRPHHPCRRGLSRKARPAPAGTPTPLTPPRRPRGRPHLFVIPAKAGIQRGGVGVATPPPTTVAGFFISLPSPRCVGSPCHRPLAPARRRTLPSRHASHNRPPHERRRWSRIPRAQGTRSEKSQNETNRNGSNPRQRLVSQFLKTSRQDSNPMAGLARTCKPDVAIPAPPCAARPPPVSPLRYNEAVAQAYLWRAAP